MNGVKLKIKTHNVYGRAAANNEQELRLEFIASYNELMFTAARP